MFILSKAVEHAIVYSIRKNHLLTTKESLLGRPKNKVCLEKFMFWVDTLNNF